MSDEKTTIWLIGPVKSTISGNKLPTIREALQLFFYEHKVLKKTIRQSAKCSIEKVKEFWSSCGIALRSIQHSITKLEKLYKEWQNLQRNQKRKKSRAQRKKEKNFSRKLDGLFDIAHQRAFQMMTQSQCDFLKSQRTKPRRGFISSNLRESESTDGRNEEINGPISSENDADGNTVTENEYSVMDAADVYLGEAIENDFIGTQDSNATCSSHEPQRQVSNWSDEIEMDEDETQKINVVGPLLTAALDRTGLSSRNASHVLLAFATEQRMNVDEMNLSSSSIQRNREKQRKKSDQQLKENIQFPDCLVVHWDGKAVSEGKEVVERLPIVVTGSGIDQLLASAKISSSSGINMATAVVQQLHEWKIADKVQAMCFDTTNSNTGRLNGACKLIEEQLDRELCYFPCRHHIYELLLRGVCETSWPVTTGPNIPMFKRFQEFWPQIYVNRFVIGIEDDLINKALTAEKEKILEFIDEQFRITQPRGDYLELLELSYIFLGGTPPRGIRFTAPGAMHHARWLAKAVYSLKIFMFREQFRLNARELRGLRDVCVFVTLFYIKAWYSAPIAIQAAHRDLNLLQELIEYNVSNPKVSNAAISKLIRHFSYLSEDIILLSLFDDSVPNEVKEEMIRATKNRENVNEVINKSKLVEADYEKLLNKNLSDFCSKKSLALLERFGINHEFLDLPLEQWKLDENYQNGLKIFTDLRVVNDCAERAVALTTQYINSLTRNEDQHQYVFRGIQYHRKEFPVASKSMYTQST